MCGKWRAYEEMQSKRNPRQVQSFQYFESQLFHCLPPEDFQMCQLKIYHTNSPLHLTTQGPNKKDKESPERVIRLISPNSLRQSDTACLGSIMDWSWEVSWTAVTGSGSRTNWHTQYSWLARYAHLRPQGFRRTARDRNVLQTAKLSAPALMFGVMRLGVVPEMMLRAGNQGEGLMEKYGEIQNIRIFYGSHWKPLSKPIGWCYLLLRYYILHDATSIYGWILGLCVTILHCEILWASICHTVCHTGSLQGGRAFQMLPLIREPDFSITPACTDEVASCRPCLFYSILLAAPCCHTWFGAPNANSSKYFRVVCHAIVCLHHPLHQSARHTANEVSVGVLQLTCFGRDWVVVRVQTHVQAQ